MVARQHAPHEHDRDEREREDRTPRAPGTLMTSPARPSAASGNPAETRTDGRVSGDEVLVVGAGTAGAACSVGADRSNPSVTRKIDRTASSSSDGRESEPDDLRRLRVSTAMAIRHGQRKEHRCIGHERREAEHGAGRRGQRQRSSLRTEDAERGGSREERREDDVHVGVGEHQQGRGGDRQRGGDPAGTLTAVGAAERVRAERDQQRQDRQRGGEAELDARGRRACRRPKA